MSAADTIREALIALANTPSEYGKREAALAALDSLEAELQAALDREATADKFYRDAMSGWKLAADELAAAEAQRDTLRDALRETHALIHRGLPYADSECPACVALAAAEGQQ